MNCAKWTDRVYPDPDSALFTCVRSDVKLTGKQIFSDV